MSPHPRRPMKRSNSRSWALCLWQRDGDPILGAVSWNSLGGPALPGPRLSSFRSQRSNHHRGMTRSVEPTPASSDRGETDEENKGLQTIPLDPLLAANFDVTRITVGWINTLPVLELGHLQPRRDALN